MLVGGAGEMGEMMRSRDMLRVASRDMLIWVGFTF